MNPLLSEREHCQYVVSIYDRRIIVGYLQWVIVETLSLFLVYFITKVSQLSCAVQEPLARMYRKLQVLWNLLVKAWCKLPRKPLSTESVQLTFFTARTHHFIQTKMASPPRTIGDLPDEILLQIAAKTYSDLRALVLVNKRFNNIFTPKLYETFRYQWPSTVRYQIPMSEQDLRRMKVPQVIRRMQNFIRTIFTNPDLASHVKIIKLHARWLDEAIDWLATRKHELGWRRIRRILETARSQEFNGLTLLLKALPNLERVDLDLNTRYLRQIRV